MIFPRLPRWSQLPTLQRSLLAGIAVGCAFLFLNDPGPEHHRFWNLLWNCGHLILFGAIGYLVGHWHLDKQRPDAKIWRHYLSWVIGAAVVGWIIELAQLVTGRDYSLLDVLGDTGGMAVGLMAGSHRALRRPLAAFMATIVVLIAFLMHQLVPVARAGVDAISAARTFPELANFADGFAPGLQRDRFGELYSRLSVVDDALRIELHPAQYAGFILDDFPNDWRGRRTLRVEIVNEGAQRPITCRVHDLLHEQTGYEFLDRFNKQFILQPGINQLSIDLDDVLHAPKGRSMDLANIRNFGCFIVDLREPQIWLLRSIRLE